MNAYKGVTKQILITKVEIMRERMIITGLKEGLNNNNTIKMSKLMDHLLNELYKVDK
ncbi:aspartyl-phosphate phosphatase Spo0E family protein [Priestia megaterium]|uniref:aspartyl-phosphate phosphatase Spo0E family protein n=1 Tax=Priestia megaterium TaxID=1404 RepID=UPI0021ABF541|nr:aspartyl-phosphate phosphatase Spo0E family protein [Priestia megaterium]MCR8925448.1 aspartyl-phosphate phosphatase Spo0E family protein [Priestia megaterium]